MPKNSQELIQIAGQWANTVKNDIRTQMVNFIESSHLTEEQVADMFALTIGELDQIIRGNGECTITTLTKLLIITGNTLEIKPISQSPLGDYENVNPHVQRPQSAPHAPQAPKGHTQHPMGYHPQGGFGVDSKGRPLPDPMELFGGRMPAREPSQAEMDRLLDEYWARKNGQQSAPSPAPTPWGAPVPPRPQMPQRDAHGRFVKKPSAPHTAPIPPRPQMPEMRFPTPEMSAPAPENRFSTMTRAELIHLIEENLWDSEIDTQSATVEALRAFLTEKETRINQRRNPQPQQPTPAPAQNVRGNDEIANFANAMRSFVEQNPQLRDTMKSIFG